MSESPSNHDETYLPHQTPSPESLSYDAGLRAGMYVRVPIDGESARSLADCRDFRIGQISAIEDELVVVQFFVGSHDSYQQKTLRLPLNLVRRCRLFENAPILYLPTQKRGILLTALGESFTYGQPMRYYVLVSGAILVVDETDMRVEAHYQAPDPAAQLAEYEFHSPIWKFKRDQLLESYLELQSATFGLEELVGSRILLLPHQAETIARVLGDRTCRYVLADEVGLGKTIEASVILKGLYRRKPDLKTLIVTPRALTRQWHNELNRKFWLDLSLATPENRFEFNPSGSGIIISIEDLEAYPKAVDSLIARRWDLLIVDEAHRLHLQPKRYRIAQRLSEHVEHCLILSATPILRRAEEYLALLRLMNPAHYNSMSVTQFEAMLSIQSDLRKRLAYVGQALHEDDFEAEEFHEEIDPLVEQFTGDAVLPELIAAINPRARDRGLKAAQEAHSYLSENYRIENRVIRNRRASVANQTALPVRALDQRYSYLPGEAEGETLAELVEYGDFVLRHAPENVDTLRILFYAGASSPFALRPLVMFRLQCLTKRGDRPLHASDLEQRLAEIPAQPGEAQRLERILWHIDRWQESTQSALDSLPLGKAPLDNAQHRVLQVMRALKEQVQDGGSKVLVFCRWIETYQVIATLLSRHYGSRQVATFHARMNPDQLQAEVDRFQSHSDCRILLTDELGGEGRNFQIADVIIHVDLPWTPAQIEQRIGRIDRLGRAGVVTSIVPYARNTQEADLFHLWQGAFELFTRSMSGMEIVLETIQDEIESALTKDPREGLAKLLDHMTARARHLRDVVEDERYAEESAVRDNQRKDLALVLDRYRDGEKLRAPLLKWADLAGVTTYPQSDQTGKHQFTVFDPKNFSPNAIKNAKLFNLPNMEEALRRSGHQRALVIRGTFDRELAVQREDVVFFAPGELWTDALIDNALCADRGQCAAVRRAAPELAQDWEGFEFLYSIRVDPRSLFATGGDPVHLFHAQGYLSAPCYRILVGMDGQVVARSSPIWKVLHNLYPSSGDIHLGKRSGQNPALELLMERLPRVMWQETVRAALAVAETKVQAEYEFASELAEEAHSVFQRRITGQRTAHRWLHGEQSNAVIDEYEHITNLLVEGIAKPRIRLESACFWWLQAGNDNHDSGA